MPARFFSNSAAKCGGLPLPVEAKSTRPFCALAQVMNSLTLLAGTPGCTTIKYGPPATMPTIRFADGTSRDVAPAQRVSDLATGVTGVLGGAIDAFEGNASGEQAAGQSQFLF